MSTRQRGVSVRPVLGDVFVFRSRRATAIKLLLYDGQGFWLCHERLSEGRFCHWPDARGEAQREQRDSAPIMKRLKEWIEQQLANKRVKPNSELGKAYNDMPKR